MRYYNPNPEVHRFVSPIPDAHFDTAVEFPEDESYLPPNPETKLRDSLLKMIPEVPHTNEPPEYALLREELYPLQRIRITD